MYKPYFQLKPFIHKEDIAKQKESSTIIAAWQHVFLLGKKINCYKLNVISHREAENFLTWTKKQKQGQQRQQQQQQQQKGNCQQYEIRRQFLY